MLCNIPEGYGEEGDARGVQDVYLWPIHVDVWQNPSQCFKVIIPQSK